VLCTAEQLISPTHKSLTGEEITHVGVHVLPRDNSQKKHLQNKLVPYGTDGRLFRTDVSANFKVT